MKPGTVVKKLDQQALFEKGYIASPNRPDSSSLLSPPVQPSPAPLCVNGTGRVENSGTVEHVEDITQNLSVATQDASRHRTAPTVHTQSPDAIQSIQGSQESARITAGTQGTVEMQKPRPVQKIHTLSTQDLKTGTDASRGDRRSSRRNQVSRQRIRVASYCRVSTWHEVQVDSVRAQEAHYRRVINANPEWELAGIYIEIGVTGTRADIRPQLQGLLAECRKGRVDLILVKSISRFARNVTDALQMIRELTSMGVVIRFEEEKINTGTAVSEFMIAIMSVFAEEESHSISGNTKWGIRQRFREGKYRPARDLFGYSILRRATGVPTPGRRAGTDVKPAVGNDIPAAGETVENSSPGKYDAGNLHILHDEAAVVREVYGMVLSGIGTELIAESLNRRRIRTRDGFEWTAARVADLVRNPTYRGDRLYQRTYKDENFRQRRNLGNLPWYYDEGCHIGIVSREVYDVAQGVVAQHRHENGIARLEEDGIRAGKINTRYGFSGRLYCKHCGRVMRRKTSPHYSSYACVSKRRRATTSGTTADGRPGSTASGEPGKPHPTVRVQEDSIKAAFLTVLNKLAYSEKQRKQHRVVSRYIEMIDACHPQSGTTGSGGTGSVGNSGSGGSTVSVEDRGAREREEAETLEAELKAVRQEAARLAATAQVEGFSARNIEQSNELHDREQRILREMEHVDTMHSATGIHSDTGSRDKKQAAVELKSFIRKWTPTCELSAYRDKDFLRFVEKVVVGRSTSDVSDDTGRQDEKRGTGEASYTITFHFICGLILTEEVGA